MSTSNQSNAAAVRAFRVLETLAEAGGPLSMTELVDALGLPKQTVHRILVQLMDAWLVTRGAGDRLYECSPRVRMLAVNVLMHAGPAAARHVLLEQLVAKIGETCNLTMLVRQRCRLCGSGGNRVAAAHAFAAGVACAAALLGERQAFAELSAEGSARACDRDVAAARLFGADHHRSRRFAQLTATRRRLLAINDQEHLQGLIAIAVP